MMRLETTYVPDELFAELGKAVDHFEFDDVAQRGTAVFADDRREEFSTVVTDEMRAAARAERLAEIRASGGLVFGPFYSVVERRNFRPQIVGITP